jgi:putative flippase GtrA
LKKIAKELLIYLVVGGLATLTHYSILVLMVQALKFSVTASSVFGSLAGAVVAFIGNENLTFHQTNQKKRNQRILKFSVVALIGIGVNGLLMWQFTTNRQLPYLLHQFMTTVCVLAITYTANRNWTFK